MTGDNPFLTGSVSRVFFNTAAPIILVMVTSGLFSVVDAVFVGRMVGADALTAVTAMFPLFMVMVALSTLVSSGMASRLARQLGAGERQAAAETRSSALLLCALLAVLAGLVFAWIGRSVIAGAVNHDPVLSAMSRVYITPLVYGAVLNFVLSVESDCLRSEGKAARMAQVVFAVTFLNIGFNYLLIGPVGLGVLGSSLGTLAAQAVALVWILSMRLRGHTVVGALLRLPRPFHAPWGQIIALGLPPALNFMGVSLLSGFVIVSIQRYGAAHYDETLAAYGIITRVTVLTFLPLLGFNLAAQSVVGNNFGAGLYHRVNAGLKLALQTAAFYCGSVTLTLIVFAQPAASVFVDDPTVIAEVGRILPIFIASFIIGGVVLILAGYFQALGDVVRATILGLGRIYLFSLPLLALMPRYFGEIGIWFSTPAADSAMLLLTVGLLAVRARRQGRRYGIFFEPAAKTHCDPRDTFQK